MYIHCDIHTFSPGNLFQQLLYVFTGPFLIFECREEVLLAYSFLLLLILLYYMIKSAMKSLCFSLIIITYVCMYIYVVIVISKGGLAMELIIAISRHMPYLSFLSLLCIFVSCYSQIWPSRTWLHHTIVKKTKKNFDFKTSRTYDIFERRYRYLLYFVDVYKRDCN